MTLSALDTILQSIGRNCGSMPRITNGDVLSASPHLSYQREVATQPDVIPTRDFVGVSRGRNPRCFVPQDDVGEGGALRNLVAAASATTEIVE